MNDELLRGEDIDAGNLQEIRQKKIHLMQGLNVQSHDVSLPVPIVSVGLGTPFIATSAIASLVTKMGLLDRLVNVINEMDYVPSMLNVAHSALLLANSMERIVRITRALQTFFRLLPMNFGRETTILYAKMTLCILDRVFQNLKDET